MFHKGIAAGLGIYKNMSVFFTVISSLYSLTPYTKGNALMYLSVDH